MKHNVWLRRHAVQLAAQLPEDTEQALAVLDYAILVESFSFQAKIRPCHPVAARQGASPSPSSNQTNSLNKSNRV